MIIYDIRNCIVVDQMQTTKFYSWYIFIRLTSSLSTQNFNIFILEHMYFLMLLLNFIWA